MDTGSGTGARRLRLLASVAATGALVAAGAASAALAQDPSPMTSSGPPVVQGWVGTRIAPAGLYSWTVGDKRRWMHKVPAAWPSEGSVEITIGTVDEQADRPAAHGILGEEMKPGSGYTEVPEPVADTRFRTWIMGIDGSLVAVVVKSYADTSPEFLAEAEAIVRSIYVEPQPKAAGVGRRVVFTLPAGWDSG
jgi:hypothetical protein